LYLVLKTYLRKRQLITKANVILASKDNLKIVNKIVITTKIR